jgi:hypothetical protein
MRIIPKVLVGGAEVYISGNVVSQENDVIEIIPAPDALNPYRLIIIFEQNTENSASRIDSASTENNSVTVKLINFNKPLGISTSSPVSVGILEGKTLLLSLAVHVIGNSPSATYVTEYTIKMESRGE